MQYGRASSVITSQSRDFETKDTFVIARNDKRCLKHTGSVDCRQNVHTSANADTRKYLDMYTCLNAHTRT